MNAPARDESPGYRASLRAILDGHAARRSGATEVLTPEQQDALEGAWDSLTEREQERLWGLSADLYQLLDQELPDPAAGAEVPKAVLLARLREAMSVGRWDEALRLLRQAPQDLSPAQKALFRGRAWQSLGQVEVALLFYDFAARLEVGTPPVATPAPHTPDAAATPHDAR